MKERDVGSVPVRDGERLLGVVTDRDIAVRATAAGEHPRAVTVREVMTPVVVTCTEDQDVGAAARLMEEQQIRRLPVAESLPLRPPHRRASVSASRSTRPNKPPLLAVAALAARVPRVPADLVIRPVGITLV
jgi:CBS domain-containing protein